MRMRYVLSPCGTSLLTNQAEGKQKKLCSDYANVKDTSRIPAEDRAELESIIARAEGALEEAGVEEAARLSAEINGISGIYGKRFDTAKGDVHVLLCTDTWLGGVTGRLVAQWLKGQGVAYAETKVVPDLRTDKLKTFQLALSDVVNYYEQTVKEYRSGRKVIFNLTGGFKSIQGFLQTLAPFYADETVYIFERSEELLRIPSLPVKLEPGEAIRDNLQGIRRLAGDLPVAENPLPDSLLVTTIDGQLTLSPWGELMWKESSKEIYGEKLYDPPSERIRYSDQFRKDTKGLEKSRFATLNTRMDQLAAFLERKDSPNPNALDFKDLKGDPVPPSTHEMDTWSDNAGRIFGHYEGSTFVLDRLGRHIE